MNHTLFGLYCFIEFLLRIGYRVSSSAKNWGGSMILPQFVLNLSKISRIAVNLGIFNNQVNIYDFKTTPSTSQ